MIPLVFYSHSDYSDVWTPLFAQTEKYLKGYKKYLFTDQSTEELDNDWIVIRYDDSLPYQKRMLHCLGQVEEDIILFHHEDMFLYDSPDKEKMSSYEQIVLDEDIDFIRLIRSVDAPSFPYKKNSTLFPIPNHSQYFFSVQPTICKTQSLLKICKETKISHLREFEIKVQKTCRKQNIRGLFHYDNENKAGLFHYDSSVYPYIATAIVKGKWNMTGYPNRLQKILKEYDIDQNIRGTI